MARLKIELPQNSLATFNIPIRITDINYGNHAGNNAIVEIIHEARMQFLKQHGFTELDAGGTALTMSELLVEFKGESFYGDILEVCVYAGEISRKSFELFYRLTSLRSQNVVIAHAKTGMVCFNYALKKIDLLPKNLRDILESHS